MNQQSPQQQPASQSQGSQPTPPLPQSQPKKPRRLSTQVKVALIGAGGVILAAIISGIFTLHPFPPLPPNPNPNPTATSHPSPNVYPPVGWKLFFSDPMKSNSSGYWPVSSDKNGSCSFTNDVYQVSSITLGGYYCALTGKGFDFTNFAFEVQMAITKGDRGDILFRLDVNAGNGYDFWISPSGTYGLEIGENNSYSKTLHSSSNTAINTGLNQLNTVAVVSQGNIFHLYVNDQLIDVVTDPANSFSHGIIGLEANPVSNPTQVFFSNVKVWTPSS